jgi:hypothetical protein
MPYGASLTNPLSRWPLSILHSAVPPAMENDKLTAAGLPVYDLNLENIDCKDKCATLGVLVNSCILAIPHCAPIFWRNSLFVVAILQRVERTATWTTWARAPATRTAGDALCPALGGSRVYVQCKINMQCHGVLLNSIL